MKIKLTILESDSNYLQRVVTMFNTKFAEELEIYSFTDIVGAMDSLEEKKIDVFLAGDSFDIDFNHVPNRCGFAYLVDSLDINSIDGHKAICKFQKGELIYKQIMSIYSEHVPNVSGMTDSNNSSMKTIIFCSPCGGVGTSTAAAAAAIALTNAGKRVLYLNCDVYGDSDLFFSCDGQFDFSDVIYAVKSNKTNRAMKFQSTVKQDQTGVYFYSSVKVPLDMMELTMSDYLVLLGELKTLGCYDYVILDKAFPVSHNEFELFNYCNSIVFVTEPSDVASAKFSKALTGIRIIDSQSEFSLIPRMWVLYNKVGVNEFFQSEIHSLGTIPIYQSVNASQMARQLALSGNIFTQLM